MGFSDRRLRALIPLLAYMFAVVIAFVVKYVWRVLFVGMRSVPPVRRAMDSVQSRISTSAGRLSKSVQPGTIAELSFIGIILASILILSVFAPMLVSLTTSTSDPSMLSTSSRTLHRAYLPVMTALIAALVPAWRRLSLYLHARQAAGISVVLARWGGLAWIVAIVLITTMPWRLLYNHERPRALLNGERAYILLERDGGVVIYNAQRRTTHTFQTPDITALERLNTVGYVFETPEEFAQSRAES